MKYGFNKRHCPCLICLKQPICKNKRLSINGNYNITCEALARYVAPKGRVIPLRYIHVRKIFPNLKHIRGGLNDEISFWLDIPSDLILTNQQRKMRLDFGYHLPEYTMPKK
ncbi:MAG: hypothetical protein ACFFG0_03965 [Candidatus Thorarchaeota archaeon]